MDAPRLRRRDLIIALGLGALVPARAFATPSVPRRLTLRHEHTGESFDGYYRDGDGPVPEVIADLAWFFRDHHVGRPGPLDFPLLDFLADLLDVVGQRRVAILSAYRTPETNARLAATTFGVAEHSQHLYGRALDITFEGRLDEAMEVALQMRRGGVGWYPQSHFIHLDSGPVRSWQIDGGDLRGLMETGHSKTDEHLPVIIIRGGVASGAPQGRGRLPVILRGSVPHGG